jgi:hypothetical protein
MQSDKKLLTGRDVRRIYSISRSTLMRWHKLGMPTLRFSYGLIRYDPDAVEQWTQEFSRRVKGVSDER